MNNLLIVEGKSDKYIIENLIKHIGLKNVEVGKPVCNIDKCEDLGGTGELDKKLTAIKKRVRKEYIKKIGIIFDADSIGIEKQTNNIKKIISSVFNESLNVEFCIHIINVNGFGELEDLLRNITAFKPNMANCLDSWQECLNDQKLTDKEFNKLWIQVYEKYDCCTKEEQENMKDNCNKKKLLEDKKVYKFDADIKELEELKKFLQEFGEEE
ncbi:MAG TPA: hypothetical protein ENK99_01790 [Campylobacterales bacterium]|nr:hypothetical protein [Campylobacterales bacterium]HHD80331.1 hypothetical protein [Campylobacterales bacterium]